MGFNGTDGVNGTQGPPGIVNAELCPAGTDLENVYVLNGTTAESCDITPTSACETCFTTFLTAEQQQFVLDNAEQGDTFAEICEFLQENENNPEESEIVFGNIGLIPGITLDQQNNLFNCLVDAGGVDPKINLTSRTDDNARCLLAPLISIQTSQLLLSNTEGLVASFSPPTIAQGTEGPSALAKIEDLKKQWLDSFLKKFRI